MAVGMKGHEPITTFEQWYENYEVDERSGALHHFAVAPCGNRKDRQYRDWKREMDSRVELYGKLEKLADAEVISPKPDLPNISSGETAGLVRRIARNLVQNTPNVEVVSIFDDDSLEGIFSRHVLTSKIIGTDQYSNDMQQNLFSSTKTSLTLGFAAVVPVLLQDAAGGWFVKYDALHYRDVYPEPGAKDVRDATAVYVRRYLTKGEVLQLIKDNTPGWDIPALKTMLGSAVPPRDWQSTSHQDKKRHTIPEGYPIITWYSNTGQPFLTFSERDKLLLRIEKNKHPLAWHPVHFLVLEKDDQQPLGKSQVELMLGRQDFQDLMLNGAMKLWYRNINPSIIGYGTVNSIPNLSPGKYTQISNPNAKIEAFEVNTQTLMQYGQISQQNLGSMVNLIGAADQQMAASAGNGMSSTPAGVDAQETMVDITTNNYQKAIESFFSHYCSYALTLYFQELKAVKKVVPTAEARIQLMKTGLDAEQFNEDQSLDIDFEKLATEYFVRCVPGSLVELEDEKQLRILNELFVPLSQAMPALAAVQDPTMLEQAAAAMRYIIQKQIELSGSASARDLSALWTGGEVDSVTERDRQIMAAQESIGALQETYELEAAANSDALSQLQGQVSMLVQAQQLLMEKLGVVEPGSGTTSTETGGDVRPTPATPATVGTASA